MRYYLEGDLTDEDVRLRHEVVAGFPVGPPPPAAEVARLDGLHEGELSALLGFTWKEAYDRREEAIYGFDIHLLTDRGFAYYLPAYLLCTLGITKTGIVENLMNVFVSRGDAVLAEITGDQQLVVYQFILRISRRRDAGETFKRWVETGSQHWMGVVDDLAAFREMLLEAFPSEPVPSISPAEWEDAEYEDLDCLKFFSGKRWPDLEITDSELNFTCIHLAPWDLVFYYLPGLMWAGIVDSAWSMLADALCGVLRDVRKGKRVGFDALTAAQKHAITRFSELCFECDPEHGRFRRAYVAWKAIAEEASRD